MVLTKTKDSALVRLLPCIFCVLLLLYFHCEKVHAQEYKKINNADTSNTRRITHDTNLIFRDIRAGMAIKESSPDSAMIIFRDGLQKSIETDYTRGCVDALFGMGLTVLNKGKVEEAFTYFRKSLPYCQRWPEKLMPFYFNNMATAYHYKADYLRAMQYYLYALDATTKPSRLEVLVQSNLAGIYMRFDKLETAAKHLDKAEQSARKQGFSQQLAYVLNNRANIYLEFEQFEKAEKYFGEGYALADTHQLLDLKQMTTSGLGTVYLRKGDPGKAIPYFQQAIRLGEEGNLYTSTIFPNTFLGDAYYKMGNYKSAKEHYLKVLALEDTTELKDNIIQTHKKLYRTYKSLHDEASALKHLELVQNIGDSVMNKELQEQLNSVEVKFRTAQKDKELAEKKQLIAEQTLRINDKNKWILTGFMIAILLGSVILMLQMRYKHRQRLQSERFKRIEQDQEISILKAISMGEENERMRIGRELHDGVGGLLSAAKIGLSTMKNRNDHINSEFSHIIDLVDDANSELRKTAYNLIPETLLKKGLSQAISGFCEQVGRGQDTHISVQFYGQEIALDNSIALSIYRIVQELVHNIIKHAAASHAMIQLNWRDDSLWIMAEDDGTGMETGNDTLPKGMGLKNIANRVMMLNGTLEIESMKGKGTTINIELPYAALKPNVTI